MHVHRSTAPKAIAAIAAVGLLPFGIAVVGALPAAAPPPSTTVQAASGLGTGSYVPAWVAIKTGGSSSVTLNNPGGPIGSPQTLAPAADCGVNQGAAASRFLTFQGTTRTNFSEGLASYQSGSIGVKEKKSGTSCYQVNAPTTESLRLGLGSGVTAALGSNAVASSAYLDLELKQSARILATVWLGEDVQGTYELQSGTTIGLTPLPGTTAAPFTCNNPADSGPDSGINDNCRWPISVPSWTGPDDGVFFDAITLKAVNGAFSLEGGGDGTVLPQSPTTTPNASVLEIVEGTVGCGGQTRTEAAAGDEPQVTVYRLGNVGTTSCAPVPYSLSNAVKSAQFLKPLDSQTSAQFLWDLQWKFPQNTGTTALPNLKIDFEVPAPGSTTTLGWCPDPTYGPSGQFLGYSGGLPASASDQEPDLVGVQYACVVSRDSRTVDGSPDVIGAHDVVYVYGDARLGW
jgi:hypothetical protein